MIIGVDTRIANKKKTGMGYILANLLPLLLEMDKNNQYVLLGSDLGMEKPNFKAIRLPNLAQKILNYFWKKFFLPSANLFLGKIDRFFFPNFVDFPVSAEKKFLMIADLSFIKYPQFAEKKNQLFLSKNVGSAIKRADKIITLSESAKKEIIEYYKIPSDKVEVVYLGCPKNIYKIDDEYKINEVKNKYGIGDDYILFVGTLEPRKNIEGLIQAYSLLNDAFKEKYQLAICGGKGWYYDKIFKLVNTLKLNGHIVFTGYVPEQDLSSIYSGAALFAFPSFYEGFGLPILEAFTCGIPVLVSNNSSLPEVAGEAVIYCDAEKVETIKDGIEKILTDNKLRNELVEKGFIQLQKFSWDKTAEKVVKLLNG